MNKDLRQTEVGTIVYFTPEMINREGHDQSTDIWCIGVMTYELLTGKNPFMLNLTQSMSDMEKDTKIQENILKCKLKFPPDFPALAKDFVNKVVKKEKNRRLSLEQML